MNLEILVVRDPDAPTDITVYVDGVESIDYRVEVVDPGAGHTITDWREGSAALMSDADLSPAFRELVLAARARAESSPYVEDDRYPSYDVAWQLHKENALVQLWEHYADLSERDKDRLDGFACEQVSRLFVAKLREAGWDAWLMHGDDPQSVDGMIGDHYWVAVEDDGMVEHLDLTYQQFANVADPAVALAVDAAAGEWPLQWHTTPDSPRHQVVPFDTIVVIND